jgi:hypothetical protein
MTTPIEHIDAIKSIAQEIEANHAFVSSAHIDDWGRYSNFTLIIEVKPESWNKGTTRKLNGVVKKAIEKSGSHLRDTFPPEAIRKWDNLEGKSYIVGYHADFWKFDIDYNEYNSTTNTFLI